MRYLLVLLLITGCAVRSSHFYMGRAVVLDASVNEAKEFIRNVAEEMPKWDADEPFAGFERAEIALVKADILSTQQKDGDFFENVDKLHADWDALVALDEQLHKSYVI